MKKFYIYGLGVFIFMVLSVTNPSKKDFDQYISSYIRDYVLQISEDNDTANLASGISFLILQSNNNIILSDKSKVNTKPQLEIWADDVKCSHGCTVGQMDDDAIFYLMSRGISRKDSINLLLSAFSSEIIEKITDEKMKSLFTELIKKQLEKFNDE